MIFYKNFSLANAYRTHAKKPGGFRRAFAVRKENLLDGDGSANFFELSLSSFCFFFWQTFFDHLRSVVYNFLSFLEAETGEFTNDLDDFDLLIANGGEFYIEFGLFFFSSAASSSTSASYSYSSCGYAEFFFEAGNEFAEFNDGELFYEINNLSDFFRHDNSILL